MRKPVVVGAVIMLASVACGYAATPDLSPTFREKATQLCTADAMRLCLAYVMDEGQMTRCMLVNRSQLTPSCRVIVDQGSRMLKR